jgi:hypothetical protein
MYWPLASSDYYADSATPRAHQPASGLTGPPPAARRARGASHVHHDPFDRVGSWLYPYSPSGGHSQHPTGHHARIKQPAVERAAIQQSGIVAVDDPGPPGFGSFEKSRGFYHHFAFALPFGLASTHAGVWQCRPAVTLSGRLTSSARSRALAVPSFSGPLHQPGAGIPAGTDEMFIVLHLLSHGTSWRRLDFLGFHHRWVRGTTPASKHLCFLARWPSDQAMQRARGRIHELTDRRWLRLPVEEVVQNLNRFLRGWAGYFRYGNSAVAFDKITFHALVRLAGFIAKRHNRTGRYGWWAVIHQSPNRLGLIDLSGTIVAPRPNRPWRAGR